ncbi:MAG: hypothetical protein RJA22_2334 [Verrucomicrobiota bacterium]|jgi:hypothetical protein
MNPACRQWPAGWLRIMVPALACLLAAAAVVAAPPVAGGLPPVRRLPAAELLVHATRAGAVLPVTNLAAWAVRRAEIVAGFEAVIGPWPGPGRRGPVEWRLEEEVDAGTHLRRRITYVAEPGGRVPAYLLVPKDAVAQGGRRHSAVLALHQTRPEGPRAVVGLADSPDDEYGLDLVRRGFVVLAPAYPLLGEYQPDLRALGWGSGTLKAAWDNSRGLDLLASLPFVRTNRGFGVIGHSLGGHNGVFTATLDPRLSVVVSSCGLDRWADYYRGDPAVWRPERGWCQVRYMPALTNYAGRLADIPFDFPELIAALAPRVCFLSAPRGDGNFQWTSVAAIGRAAGPVYALHGVPERLVVTHPETGHRFPEESRERAYRLLEEHLR